MRTSMSIVFFSALVNFVLCRPENKMYTTKYDELDVNALLKSERLLMIYVGCLLDEKPCTADGAELKRNLPDALTNGCSLCSEPQKIFADKISHHLIDNDPAEWSKLEAKYDPTGSYKKLYLENKTDTS